MTHYETSIINFECLFASLKRLHILKFETSLRTLIFYIISVKIDRTYQIHKHYLVIIIKQHLFFIDLQLHITYVQNFLIVELEILIFDELVDLAIITIFVKEVSENDVIAIVVALTICHILNHIS